MLAFALFAPGLAVAQISNRLALVIGNDTYLSTTRLVNSRNDARLMAATLRDAKFDVTEVSDLDFRQMGRQIDHFASRIKKGDDIVFFFAGHGLQIGSEPLLLPTDISAENEAQVIRESFTLAQVQDRFKDARFALLVIDACRDNPFPPKGTRSVGGASGMSLIEPAQGNAIIMSAGRNQKALDEVPGGTKDNGLFTFEFVRQIRVPGVDIKSALESVRERVEDRALRSNHKQRPALQDETRGKFFFFDGPGAATATSTSSAPAAAPVQGAVGGVRIQSAEEAEQEFWNAIRESRDVADFADYEKRYPNGRFVAQAARQIRMLRRAPETGNIPTAPPLAVALAVPPPSAGAAAGAVARPEQIAAVRPPAPAANGLVTSAPPAGAPKPAAALVPVPGEIVVGGTRFKGKFVQEPADRTLTGTGEIKWANGDVFVGNLFKGKRQGEGEITWSSGQYYKGEWDTDQPNGKGSMKFPSGDIYEGVLVNGQAQGVGRMAFASGDVYTGEFARGASNGIGTYVWKNGQRFEGPWVNDKPQGKGKLTFAGGDVFEGQVVNGVPEGEGVMRYVSSDTYTGSFSKGKPNGKGRYNWKSGDSYDGAWANGLKHGNGVFMWSTGDKWEGEFANDAQTANGKTIPKVP